MREPKNLAEYVSRDAAAKGLEALAADIRGGKIGEHKECANDLVKWDINVRFWNPAWKAKAKR